MIHNLSTDPVLIKKISLKIWSLRDEIEAKANEKIVAGEVLPENFQEKVEEIRTNYSGSKKANTDSSATTITGINDQITDPGELEMARAIAGESAPEEETETAESNVIALKDHQISNNIEISTEAPPVPEEKIALGKTILAEIDMEKMYLFTNRSFTEGQSVVIQFCIPKTFILNAQVLYCRKFNMKSRIISDNNYTHRMTVRFNFLKEGERALLRDFIKSIEPDLSQYVTKKIEKEKSEFDGLDL